MHDLIRSPEATPPAGEPSFWAVIPAGGAGTRLWPLSRATRPKFLLPLLGERSLLQQTVERLTPLAPASRTMIVCGPAHAAAAARQLPEIPEANLIVEPGPRGSGPAIGLAAALIARQDPTAIMGSFAADHEVTDPAAFERAVRVAIETARDGWLVTIGLTPTRPETGYGYIERSDATVSQTECGAAYKALRFHEKPNIELATDYVASGRFLWNASMFIWQAKTLLDEMQRLDPALHSAVSRVVNAWGTVDQEQVTEEVWASIEETTIDHGVMEKSDRVAVVSAELGWSDVGDWHGLGELVARDDVGNSVKGDLVQHESRNSVVWSETGRLIALVGIENTVIVDTEDALLVVSRDRAQDVKRIVDRLKTLQRHELR